MKKWSKTIAIFSLLLVEAFVTFLSFNQNWDDKTSAALLFAGIMILYSGFSSILDKYNPEVTELKESSTKEHKEIKGALALYKDIELLSSVVDYEGRYVKNKNCLGIEIWIISNTVAEPDSVIEIMYRNLIKDVKYYYVIPNNNVNRSEEDLKNTFDRIKKLNRSGKLFSIKYIKDDLFDLMPTDIADILFYCNPTATDYSDNMRVFIAFQNDNYDKEIYYRPIDLTEAKKQQFFMRMNEWKEREGWNELTWNN